MQFITYLVGATVSRPEVSLAAIPASLISLLFTSGSHFRREIRVCTRFFGKTTQARLSSGPFWCTTGRWIFANLENGHILAGGQIFFGIANFT